MKSRPIPRTLYHFTTLVWLPQILQEGISKGEVPTPQKYASKDQLPNLTSVEEARAQACWNVGDFDKTRVRLKVNLPKKDVLTFEKIAKKYKLRHKWIRSLAPRGEERDWFFSKRAVLPSEIKSVALAIENPHNYTTMYTALDDSELLELCRKISQEFDRIFVYDPNSGNIRSRNSHSGLSWLLDGPRHHRFGKYRPIPD